MIGRHAVAKDAERARAFDLADAAGGHSEPREERRLLHVGALLVPLEHVTDGAGDFVPLRILRSEVGVELAENFRRERGAHHVADFLLARPDVAEKNGRSVFSGADGLARKINVHAARERECDDERRRHEEVRLDVLMHARLEVAVAREHARGDEIVLRHGFLDGGMQRAAVADARRAAIADGLEAERVEILREAGLVQVIGDDARAGPERRLHRRVHFQSTLDGLLREQSRAEHHARVARVRATRDRGDEHAAVANGGRAVLRGIFAREREFDFFRCEIVRRFSVAAVGHGLGKERRKRALEVVEVDAVLRALRAGDSGDDGREIEIEVHAVCDVALRWHAPQALRLVVVLERLAVLVAAARAAQVGDGLLVNREEAHRRAVFGRHVGDGRAIHDRERLRAGAVELHKFSDDLCLAEHLRDVQHHVRRGDALGHCAGEVHADDFRRQKIDRLPEHSGFRLDAADAPSDDAETVDHRRVRVGADERVGVENW